ncbi:MAG: hypothetical protein WC549_07855 [Actinomycetota bacterium]
MQTTLYVLSPAMEEFDLDMLRNADNEEVRALIEETIIKEYLTNYKNSIRKFYLILKSKEAKIYYKINTILRVGEM